MIIITEKNTGMKNFLMHLRFKKGINLTIKIIALVC